MDSTPPTHSSPEPTYIPSRKMPLSRRIEPIFFNPSLKLAALRIALLASAAVLGCAVAFFPVRTLGDKVYIGTLSVTLLHHFLSAFKLRYIVRLCDLILLIAEFTLLSVLITFNGTFTPDRYDPTSLIVFFVATWTLVGVLFFLFICRVAAIIRHRGRNLLSPFDLLEDSLRLKNIPVQGLPAAYSMLAGRSIWNTQFAGESLAVRLMRGIVAGVFIATLIAYGVLSLAVKPVQETAVTPVKESRGPSVPFDQIKDAENQMWNIVFAIPLAVAPNDTDILRQAISVTPLWEQVEASDKNPPCEDNGLQMTANTGDDFDYHIMHISCPPRAPREDDSLLLSDILPDILIEVDYSILSIPSDVMRGMRGKSVAVYVSYTADVDFLIGNTRAIPLPPASHYLADVTGNLRKVLKHPALSGLGMFESTKTFWTADVNDITVDPLTLADPPVYDMSSGVSTFRLFVCHDTSEVQVIEDSREQSVLGGLSAIGGLWTILGGIFAMFFGTTLRRIFFGSKSLSIFGIAQQLEKDNIVEAYLQKYPKIREELNLSHPQRGIMTLLQDHMIDVALFQEAIDDAKAPVDQRLVSYDVENLGSEATTQSTEKVVHPASR